MLKLLLVAGCFITLAASAQIRNASFEEWYTDGFGQQRLVGWKHYGKSGELAVAMPGTKQTGGPHLQYALMLHRWYDYTWDWAQQRSAIDHHPASLTGHYRFAVTELSGERDKDTAYVSVVLTRWNSAFQRTDTIGIGRVELAAAQDFRPFECNIRYIRPGQADSITIEISPSKFNGTPSYCVTPGFCSYLTIDNLSLSKTGNNTTRFVYPNPVRGWLFITQPPAAVNEKVRVFNALGQLICERPLDAGVNMLDTRLWQAGVYFLQVYGKNAVEGYKIVKQ